MVARTIVRAIKAWPDDDFAEFVDLVIREKARRIEEAHKRATKAKAKQILSRNDSANAKRVGKKH
jgi:hypothetical protein